MLKGCVTMHHWSYHEKIRVFSKYLLGKINTPQFEWKGSKYEKVWFFLLIFKIVGATTRELFNFIRVECKLSPVQISARPTRLCQMSLILWLWLYFNLKHCHWPVQTDFFDIYVALFSIRLLYNKICVFFKKYTPRV